MIQLSFCSCSYNNYPPSVSLFSLSTQLPELIHMKEKGGVRFLLILMANIGFFISFVILLLIAIYEEELNTLIS